MNTIHRSLPSPAWLAGCFDRLRPVVLLVVCVLALLVPTGSSFAAGFAAADDPAPGPIVDDFQPSSGPVGTEVIITGQNFGDASLVTFGGVSATFRPGISDMTLIATVPAGATTGPLAVTTPTGTFTTVTPFTVSLTPPPLVTGFSPETGPIGTRVLINGSNFIAVTAVRFAGIGAEFTSLGDSISAAVPPGAVTGPITVVAAGGSAKSSAPFTVTAVSGPVITGISPTEGPAGTVVAISGRNLETVTGVNFNGTPATFNSFGAIFATVPDGATSGLITVTTPNGSATSPGIFKVTDPLAPGITGFTPNSGDVGAMIVITGANLQIVNEVRIGGVAAQFTLVSDTELHATVPLGATTGRIAVTSSRGVDTSVDMFYLPPAIVSFEPDHGPVGTIVRIQGLNFTDAISVQFGGANASFTVVSAVEIRATVPEGAISGAISIATPARFTSSTSNYLLPPRVTGFAPLSGPSGSEVSVTGDNLLGAISVRFGNVEAAFTSLSPTALLVTVPATAGNGAVTVTTPAGASTSEDLFFVGLFGDLGVGQESSPDVVSTGDFLRYTLVVTNRGPLEASGVVLTDRLPDGVRTIFAPSGADCVETNNIVTCQIGTVPPGGGIVVKLTVTVMGGPYLTNRVEVISSRADPDLTDNVSSRVIVLAGAPPPEVNLSATRVAQGIELSWPLPADGYVLEKASAIAIGSSWGAVNTAPTVTNGRAAVVLPVSTGTSFYRLRRP